MTSKCLRQESNIQSIVHVNSSCCTHCLSYQCHIPPHCFKILQMSAYIYTLGAVSKLVLVCLVKPYNPISFINIQGVGSVTIAFTSCHSVYRSDAVATISFAARFCAAILFEGGYYSRAAFISLESPQTSTTAGYRVYVRVRR